MRRIALICTVGLVALAAVGVALGAQELQFGLRPLNGTKVAGTGTLRSLGAETALTLKLHGLAPNKSFRTVMGTGTCARRRGPFTALGGGKAQPDGKHIILIFRATRAVACGLIPAA